MTPRRPGVAVAARLAGLAIAICMVSGILTPAPALDFTAGEKRRILRHGPWPPALASDPSNRVSGKPAAIAFGRALFFDPRLSISGTVSCASCHAPDRAWTDGLPQSRGQQVVDRNALSLFNLRFNRWFGWDGAQDTLWAQNLRPLLDRREMGVGPGGAARLVRSDRELSCGYRRAFGAQPGADDERVFVDLGKALAAFLETQVTGRTPFDEFRDALALGDAAGMARYPAAARRGLRLFVGRGNCAVCHFGPAFTNGEFADAGVPHFAEPGRVDPGRLGGIRKLRRSPYTLLAAYNDDTATLHRRQDPLCPPAPEQFRRVPGAGPAQRRAHRALYACRQPRDARRRGPPLFDARRGPAARRRRADSAPPGPERPRTGRSRRLSRNADGKEAAPRRARTTPCAANVRPFWSGQRHTRPCYSG